MQSVYKYKLFNNNEKIAYLGQKQLSLFQNTPLCTSYFFILASLSLFKSICKVLFWECWQLPYFILFNFNDCISTLVFAVKKAKSHMEPNLNWKVDYRSEWCNGLPKKKNEVRYTWIIYPHSHSKYYGCTVHKHTQWHLTVNWVTPWESFPSNSSSKDHSVISRPTTQFSRYPKWLDIFKTDLIYMYIHMYKCGETHSFTWVLLFSTHRVPQTDVSFFLTQCLEKSDNVLSSDITKNIFEREMKWLLERRNVWHKNNSE